jgi:hypothetical protein
MSLLDNLKHIKEHGPGENHYGICSNLWERPGHTLGDEARSYELMRYWPEHSGDASYSVPSGQADVPAASAYYNAGQDRWSADTPYGAARLRLLDFMIAELEKEEGEQNGR